MKIHQFRYVLFLLALTLFGVTLFVYSEEAAAQSNGDLNSPEQPPEKSTSLETQDTKPEKEKQSPEPEPSPDASRELLKNLSSIYTMIFGAFIGLVLAIAIFLGIWVGWLRHKVEASERLFQQRLNENQQDWEEQLKYINQQGKDNTQKLYSAIRNEQKKLQNSLSKLGNRLDGLELTVANMGSGRVPNKAVDVDAIIQEAQAKVELLAQVYENGEPIDIIEIDDPTPSQNALMILNWIACTIEDWANELEQSGTANPDLIQTLRFANQDIKGKLKEVRGPALPLPEPLNPDTDINTDAAYNEFKNKCAAYVSRYERLLIDYQLGRQIDETDYNQFIPQFIKDRLFNEVARFIKFEQLSEKVDGFLDIVGYEVVLIEIGKTQADARMHDIQASRQTNAESGTIVEVVLPGLQRKADGETIQKPVVIRGE